MVTYYVARSADQGAVPHMREYEVTRFSFLFGCDGGATSSLGAWCMSDGRGPCACSSRPLDGGDWLRLRHSNLHRVLFPVLVTALLACAHQIMRDFLFFLSLYISFWENNAGLFELLGLC
jgi:hypothetical protein